jgi:hypothetical protein
VQCSHVEMLPAACAFFLKAKHESVAPLFTSSGIEHVCRWGICRAVDF